MAADNPERYVSVDELRAEVGFTESAYDQLLDETSTTFDDLLSQILGEETDRIESADYADTAFEERTATETLYGDRKVIGDDLLVPRRPVRDVSSIDLVGVDETIDVSTDVEVRETHIVLLDSAPVYAWPDAVDVEYTYGYDEVPAAIREAIIRLARSRLQRIKSDGVTSESFTSGQSVSYRPPSEVRAAVMATARKFRPDSYSGGAMVV